MKFNGYMRVVCVVLFTLIFQNIIAQKQRLLVGGYSPDLYINYKVSPNETFASIASIYNISPDSLSEFNNIDYYNGPLIAKVLKVPLSAKNFTQKGIADSNEVLVPVYYMTTYNENIYQVSSKTNRVPIASIKKWNVLPATGIVKGMPILIGFLKAKPDKASYFEDTVSQQFARIDVPVAKPKVEKRLDSTLVANNSLKKNETKKPNIVTPVVKPKVDSTLAALNTKKINVKKPVEKPVVKPKVDSTLVGLNTKNINTKKPIEKPKVPAVVKDSVAAIIGLSTTTPAKVKATKPPSGNKKDTSLNVNNTTSNKATNKLSRPIVSAKKDTSVLAANAGSKGTKKINTKPIETTKVKIDTSLSIKTDIAKTPANTDNKNGYRIQVVSTSSKDEADKVKANLSSKYPGEKIYFAYQSSKYRVKVGNFSTVKEAAPLQKDITKIYPKGVYVVPDKIEANPDINTQDVAVAPVEIKKPVTKTPEIKGQPKVVSTTPKKDLVIKKQPENTMPDVAKNNTPDVKNSNETAITNPVATNIEDLTFEGIYNVSIAEKPKKQLTGDASYFESKTGWSDKKYYVLMPHVPVGTIVKITSIDNRSVFAKVLGAMPDMKDNDGILLRLSNAAVAALGVSNTKFPVVVNFY